MTVSYADLNLASVAGQKTLESRINNAANRACDVNSSEPVRVLQINLARCHETAVSGARTAIAMAKTPALASR